MHPKVAAAPNRKRSGRTAFDQVLATGRVTDSFRALDRRPAAGRTGGVARCLTTFVLGSIAQGALFVLVAAELERRGVGTNWLAAVAAVRLARIPAVLAVRRCVRRPVSDKDGVRSHRRHAVEP